MSTNVFDNIVVTGNITLRSTDIPISLYNVVNVNTSTFTINSLIADQINVFLCNTSTTSVNITLPQISSLPAGKGIIAIVDASGNARVNNITIVAFSGNTICGQSSIVINNDYNSFQLLSNTVNSWSV
jgi:hypothetical protein